MLDESCERSGLALSHPRVSWLQHSTIILIFALKHHQSICRYDYYADSESTLEGRPYNVTDGIIGMYGAVGDFREVWPALPGKAVYRVRLTDLPPRTYGSVTSSQTSDIGEGVVSLLHCHYLKYEDRGLIGDYFSRGSTLITGNSTINNSINSTWIDPNITTFSSRASVSAAIEATSGSSDSTVSISAETNATAVYEAVGRSPSPPYGGVDAAAADYKCHIRGDSWYYREIINEKLGTRTLTTNGCPNHFSQCQDQECGGPVNSSATSGGNTTTRALYQPETIVVPLHPAFATVPRDTKCLRSKVGLALNGVGIFGRADSIGTSTCYKKYPASINSTILFSSDVNSIRPYYKHSPCSIDGPQDGVLYCGDEVPVAAALMDKCGGYADLEGRYKYHVPPVCLMDQLNAMALRASTDASINETVADTDSNTGTSTSTTLKKRLQALQLGSLDSRPSPQVGWALDGFPIYGPLGTKGLSMLRCGSTGAHATMCLDDCNGYKGKIVEDEFMYRYYITGPVGDSTECSATTTNAYIDSSTGTSASVGSLAYISNGYALGINAYAGCGRNTEKCCLKTAPPSTYSPYTIGCFMGCKYGETSCTYTGEKGTSASYNARLSIREVPSTVFSEADYPASPTASVGETTEPAAINVASTLQRTRQALYQQQQSRQKSRLTTSSASAGALRTTGTYNSLVQQQHYLRPKSMVQIPFGPDYPLALVDSPDAVSANGTTITLAGTSTAAADVFHALSNNASSSGHSIGASGSSASASGYTESTSGGSASSSDIATHRPVKLEVLPSAYEDSVYGAVRADDYSQSNLLYFTSKSGVYALDEVTKIKTKLVAGYTAVTITGFNFGNAAADVQEVLVNGAVCDNIIHYGSTRIGCVLTQPGTTNKHSDAAAGGTAVQAQRTQRANSTAISNDKWFSHRDVTLTTSSGKAVGIHNQPLDVRKSGSMRPCIEGVDFQYKQFYPFALDIIARDVRHLVGDHVSTGTTTHTSPTVTNVRQTCPAFSAYDTKSATQLYQVCVCCDYLFLI